MTVHIHTPYSLSKNLGEAYNQFMRMLPDNDWACLIDYDVQLLTPDAGTILHTYAIRYPGAGLLTAYTNRAHPTSKQQLLGGSVSDNTDLTHHIKLAERQKERLYEVTEITHNISGFLILISKKQWLQIPFTESLKCLGVDTDYSKKLREAGKEILRMDGLYCWHAYRLLNGISNKSHLL